MPGMIDRVQIRGTAQEVFHALEKVFESTENYRKWNKDHISCFYKRGSGFQTGSVLCAEEYLHGIPHRMSFKITYSDPPNGFHYTMSFPFSLIFIEGSFSIRKLNGKVELEAAMTFRLQRFLGRILRKRVESLQNHMREEGLEIKRIVEERSLM